IATAGHRRLSDCTLVVPRFRDIRLAVDFEEVHRERARGQLGSDLRRMAVLRTETQLTVRLEVEGGVAAAEDLCGECRHAVGNLLEVDERCELPPELEQ